MLEVKDLHVNYGAVHALNGISLHVDDGEIVSLIGANGAEMCIRDSSKEASPCGASFCVSMSILKSSIKVSVTFGVSDTFKVAVFPASTFKEYTVLSTLYPAGAVSYTHLNQLVFLFFQKVPFQTHSPSSSYLL